MILVQTFYLKMEAWGKVLLFFRIDMSSSMHIDNRNKGTLILVEGPTQGLDDTTLITEDIYPQFKTKES